MAGYFVFFAEAGAGPGTWYQDTLKPSMGANRLFPTARLS